MNKIIVTALAAGLAAGTALTACSKAASLTAAPPTPVSSASPSAASGAGTQPTTSAPSSAAPSPANTVSSTDVCSLLTAAQASAINKVTYGPGVPKQLENGWEQCDYPNKGSADPIDIQHLSIAVINITGCWAGLQSADGPGKPVSGLGDEAFGYEIGLDVRTGSSCVTIQGLTHAEFSGDHTRDIKLAKIILAGLR